MHVGWEWIRKYLWRFSVKTKSTVFLANKKILVFLTKAVINFCWVMTGLKLGVKIVVNETFHLRKRHGQLLQ